jgi:hypothetical protein
MRLDHRRPRQSGDDGACAFDWMTDGEVDAAEAAVANAFARTEARPGL